MQFNHVKKTRASMRGQVTIREPVSKKDNFPYMNRSSIVETASNLLLPLTMFKNNRNLLRRLPVSFTLDSAV